MKLPSDCFLRGVAVADQSLKLPATQTYSLVGGRCGVKLSDAFRSEAREETSGDT